MSARERIVKVLITGDASKFQKAVGDVVGSSGKLKGALTGIGAGVGLATVGRGIMNIADDFKDASLAAHDFATASGLAGEDAARFQEVAGDLGVEAKQLESALGRLAKGLGKDDQKWRKYGVEVKRTGDGLVDTKATFLDAIDVLNKTTDPLKRAQIGSELFGKSWAELAPLVELGADGMADALAGVSDAQAKVGSEESVAKAQALREAMDTLNDRATGLKFTLASGLIPVVSAVAGALGGLDPRVVAIGVSALAVAVAIAKVTTALQGASAAFGFLLANPWVAVIAGIAAAIILIAKNWDKVAAAARGAYEWMQKASRTVSTGVGGPLQTAIGWLTGNKNFGADFTPVGFRAMGGPVSPQMPYVVGEKGPELFVPSTGGTIVPGGVAGGVTVNATVNISAGGQSRPDWDRYALDIGRSIGRETAKALRAAGG